MRHFTAIGMYQILPAVDSNAMAYVMDDFGTLVPINLEQYKQGIYFRTGEMY